MKQRRIIDSRFERDFVIPIVSIVIPVHNGARTVADTLATALDQSLQDLEVVIVDDGSTDNTAEIVQTFSDERIKLLRHDANMGSVAARATAVAECSGEFVAFLDADDLWVKHKLAKQVEALRQNPDADVAYGWTDSFTQDAAVRKRLCRDQYSGNVYRHLLLSNFVCSGSNILVRKRACENVGVLAQLHAPGEDWELALQLALRHDFVCVPEVLVYYRQCGESASCSVLKMERACLTILKSAYENAPDHLLKLRSTSLSNVYSYLIDKSLTSGPNNLRRELVSLRLLCSWLLRTNPLRVPKKLMLRIIASILLGRLYPRLRRFPYLEPENKEHACDLDSHDQLLNKSVLRRTNG